MPTKEWIAANQDRMKAYRRAYYQRNKNSEKARIYKRAAHVRAWYDDYKKTLKCSRCPEAHPACLEFHHVDPQRKERTISQMANNGASVEAILAEMEFCIILCANCHRKEHHS